MRNPTCTDCELCLKANTICLWGSGNPKANLMLVGEAPGASEDYKGKPFVGAAGDLLDHILNKLSLDRSKLYITNVFKCRPPNNKLPSAKKLEVCWESCRQYIEEEIAQVKPRVIVLMGNTPLKFLGGRSFITRNEGAWIDKKHIACFHPAYALRRPKAEAAIAAVLYEAALKAGLKPQPKGEEAGIYDYEIR